MITDGPLIERSTLHLHLFRIGERRVLVRVAAVATPAEIFVRMALMASKDLA
jgi:hypothetical protein